MRVITDPGSTHMGSITEAMVAVKKSKEVGAWACKFQLFKNKHPNIPLDYKHMKELVEYGKSLGIEVFASVWDMEALQALSDSGARHVKFAHSMKDQFLELLNEGLESKGISWDTVFVSYDWVDAYKASLHKQIVEAMGMSFVAFFCIPMYPVLFHLSSTLNDLPGIFSGFSDHTLGLPNKNFLLPSNMKYLEKHVNFNSQAQCPDASFAFSYDRIKEYCDVSKNA